jgi:GntR family transcriptional regulator, transcriptional repressor for pyruvate dehydrogenase complex
MFLGRTRMSLTQRAIDEIKAMIIRGELAAGDRLPKEADLAARLGLSRNSLREAVRALTLARILEARQGDGTYVTSLEPSMLLEPLTFMADFHQDRTLLQVLEVRRVLEAATAALAAQYITDEELAELRRVVEEMNACETVEAFVANDIRFHRLIGAASRNPILASVLDSFSTPMSRARVWRAATQADAIDQTKAQHAALYDALAHRRPDIARAMATAHIAGVESWLEGALGTEPDAGATLAA